MNILKSEFRATTCGITDVVITEEEINLVRLNTISASSPAAKLPSLSVTKTAYCTLLGMAQASCENVPALGVYWGQ